MGPEFYRTASAATGNVSASVLFSPASHQRAAPAYTTTHDQREGKIVLILDHEPGERVPTSRSIARTSSLDGPGGSIRFGRSRKAPSRCCSSPTCHTSSGGVELLRGGRATYWPEKPPRILTTTAGGLEIVSGFRSPRIRPADPLRAGAATVKPFRGARQERRDRARLSRRWRSRLTGHDFTPRSIVTSSPAATWCRSSNGAIRG